MAYGRKETARLIEERIYTFKPEADADGNTLSTYDENGNVIQTETKSRNEGESDWQIQTVKTDYDEQGQMTREYTPRGTKENITTKYEYDILGRMVQSEIPQEKKDGNIQYQKTMTGYDNTGNVAEKEEQIDSDRTAKTEYTYDKLANLVMVKSCLEGGQSAVCAVCL